MKKILLFFFCCLGFTFSAQAQHSKLNCDIKYLCNQTKELTRNNVDWIFSTEPRPDLEFDLEVDKDKRKDSTFSFYFHSCEWVTDRYMTYGGFNLFTTGLVNNEKYVHVKLQDANIFWFKSFNYNSLKYDMKNDDCTRRMKDAPSWAFNKLDAFIKSLSKELKPGDYKEILEVAVEQSLRQITEGNVLHNTQANPQPNLESIIADYDLRLDKDKNFNLTVFASDGKKIGDYNVGFMDVIHNFMKLPSVDHKLWWWPMPVSVKDLIETAVKDLTAKFIADSAGIGKVNNQKENMQNTYRNDTERLEVFKSNWQFHMREYENR